MFHWTVTLPPFLASRLGAWFAFVESKFSEKAVDKQARKFVLLLAALPEKVLDQMIDVVDNMPADFPYNVLKARLLETLMLSDQEKFDILFKMEPLGGRKLLQLLSYCPPAMEQMSIMFQYMSQSYVLCRGACLGFCPPPPPPHLDPDPAPDPHQNNADPQPWAQL